MGEAVVEITTGSAGTGKSFCRVAQFILDEWLKDHEGTIYTNVNLGRVPEDHTVPPKRKHESFIRRLCVEAARRYGGQPTDYAKRVRRIPPVVVKSWLDGEKGPWSYFNQMSLAGAHIQIDEIHNFCPASGAPQRANDWRAFLGEVRHMGCTIEFLTQHKTKVNRKIFNECNLRRTLDSVGLLRDPFFKIPMGDWYQLLAIATGRVRKKTIVEERILRSEGWELNHSHAFTIDPAYFAFYNSFERPHAGGKSGKTSKDPFYRFGRLGTIRWFLLRHLGKMFGPAAILCVGFWFCFLGGGSWTIAKLLDYFQLMAQSNTSQMAQAGSEDKDDAVEPAPQVVQATAPKPVIGPTYDPSIYLKTGDQQTTLEDEAEAERAAELVDAWSEVAKARAELDQLKAKRRAQSIVVLLTPEKVTFREGFSYGVDETIDFGEYEGRTIQRIDYHRRLVLLDDGSVLRMGRFDPVSVPTPRADDVDQPPSLPGPLRTGTTPRDDGPKGSGPPTNPDLISG